MIDWSKIRISKKTEQYSQIVSNDCFVVVILFIVSGFPFDYILPNNKIYQTDQYRKGYQPRLRNWRDWNIRVRECQTWLGCNYWENWKPICQTTAKSIYQKQRAFSSVLMVLLIIQQFNVMLKCRTENTFHCRWFQINDTNCIYTNDWK